MESTKVQPSKSFHIYGILVAICLFILSAVVLFLCIVKTCTVNESLGGNDVRSVRVTNPSDSLAEVVLLSNRTPIGKFVLA